MFAQWIALSTQFSHLIPSMMCVCFFSIRKISHEWDMRHRFGVAVSIHSNFTNYQKRVAKHRVLILFGVNYHSFIKPMNVFFAAEDSIKKGDPFFSILVFRIDNTFTIFHERYLAGMERFQLRIPNARKPAKKRRKFNKKSKEAREMCKSTKTRTKNRTDKIN